MVKIYFDNEQFIDKPLYELFERDEFGNIKINEAAASLFSLVINANEADWIFIPTPISWLMNTQGKAILKQNAALASSLGIKCAVVSNSDLVFNPGSSEYHIFTPGPFGRFPNQLAIPALFKDPLLKWYEGNWTPLTQFKEITAGFCGQATNNVFKTTKDILQLLKLKVSIWNKKSNYLFVPFFLAANERSHLLKSLSKSKIIKTDFILRKKYKGGSKTAEDQKKNEFEFFQNIYQNLFTVCLRGFGNYSVRFYQTLAMGRIPVLINTDSVLPFEKFVSYGDCVLRIPFEERHKADIYMEAFVRSKTPAELIAIQKRCRQIWEEELQLEGSLKNLSLELVDLSQKAKQT